MSDAFVVEFAESVGRAIAAQDQANRLLNEKIDNLERRVDSLFTVIRALSTDPEKVAAKMLRVVEDDDGC